VSRTGTVPLRLIFVSVKKPAWGPVSLGGVVSLQFVLLTAVPNS